jgi:mannose-6-phosphate isomerase
MEEVLKLTTPPIAMQSIWGDGRLAKRYGYELADGVDIDRTPIGAMFCEDDTIASGEHAGRTVGWLYENEPDWFGTEDERRWEILPVNMACMYAAEDLSVQVHPREDWANEHLGAHGKSECWYFPEVDEPTTVVLGTNATSVEELKDYVDRGDWDNLLCRRPVEAGSFYAIKAGTVHAVQKGCMFIEICNPSPITYRFYDYDRLDKDGKPRRLDLDLAYENVLVPDQPVEFERRVRTDGGLTETFLADNENYAAWLWECDGGCGRLSSPKPFAGVYVLEGEGTLNGVEAREGELLLVTKAAGEIEINGNVRLLCCHS